MCLIKEGFELGFLVVERSIGPRTTAGNSMCRWLGLKTKSDTQREENPSSIEPLEIIEVQTGDYLGEDDIVRESDDFGRA